MTTMQNMTKNVQNMNSPIFIWKQYIYMYNAEYVVSNPDYPVLRDYGNTLCNMKYVKYSEYHTVHVLPIATTYVKYDSSMVASPCKTTGVFFSDIF